MVRLINIIITAFCQDTGLLSRKSVVGLQSCLRHIISLATVLLEFGEYLLYSPIVAKMFNFVMSVHWKAMINA